MQTGDFQLYAPAFFPRELSDTEILGAVVWLWSHSAKHRDIPLHSLADTVMPFIIRQQYVLLSGNSQPLAMMSWALFDAAAEQRYLTLPYLQRPETDWLSGDRLWCMDWLTPFGHSRTLARLLTALLFPEICLRALYHRGDERGCRVLFLAGSSLPRSDVLAWRKTHPLTVSLPETWLCGGRK